MKVTNTIDISAWLEENHVSVYLYLTDTQSDPLEFEVPYEEIIDSVVESNVFPHSGKMDERGIEELESMAKVFDDMAAKIRARATEFKEKANEL